MILIVGVCNIAFPEERQQDLEASSLLFDTVPNDSFEGGKD